jgi:hypothetical protein
VLAPQERPLHTYGLERLGGGGDERVQTAETVEIGESRRIDAHVVSNYGMGRLSM